MNARKQFAEDNINLVYTVIHKNFKGRIGGQYEFGDFVSLGMIGLLKAIDNFKPEFGTKFSTYAVPMIWGEIARDLRDKDSMLKIPRPMKQLQYQAFKNNLLESPVNEVAEKLGITERKAAEVLRLKQATYVDSLDREISEDDSTSQYEKIGGYVQDFDTELLLEDIDKLLTQRESQVIKLSMNGKTQLEIAAIIGKSQVGISRTLSKAKPKLIKYLRSENMETEVKPCVTRKPTIVDCIKHNIDIEKAGEVQPNSLILADYIYLRQQDKSKQAIKNLYNFKHDAAFYKYLRDIGAFPEPLEIAGIQEKPEFAELGQDPVAPEIVKPAPIIVEPAPIVITQSESQSFLPQRQSIITLHICPVCLEEYTDIVAAEDCLNRHSSIVGIERVDDYNESYNCPQYIIARLSDGSMVRYALVDVG